MKIIQFFGKYEGFGGTRYAIELNKALKAAGHEVEFVYFNNNIKSKNNTQNPEGLVVMDYGQELFDKLNDCDILFLMTLISKKATDEYKKKFYDTLMHVNNPTVAMCFNDHSSVMEYKLFVNEFTNDLEFIKKIDKFITFSPYNPCFQKLVSLYPDFIKRYVHMRHPYTFADSAEPVPFEKKYKRIEYNGRFAISKDPMRLIKFKNEFADAGFQVEMRGVDRTPAAYFTDGLLCDLQPDGSRTPSVNTIDLLSPKKRLELYPDYTADLIHLNDRDLSKVYLFGKYDREEGMKAMSYSMFGCDFHYKRKNVANTFGDNLEYAVVEVIDAGSIPLLDKNTIDSLMLHDEDGMRTTTPISTLPCGIGIAIDGSNIKEAVEYMNELASDKEKYDKYREECLKFYKDFFDPAKVIKRLMKDLTTEDNSYALAEFNYVIPEPKVKKTRKKKTE